MRYYGDGKGLVAEDLPCPEPSRKQVRVRVAACGVCRTDLHVIDDELPDPRLPIGFESREEKPGQVGVTKPDVPKYGRGEIGLDLFPFVAGAAVGIDVFELVDFFTSFVGYDIAKDEL